MKFFRRLGLGLAASVFSLSLFLLAICISLYAVFDKPGPLKTAIKSSGIYEVGVDSFLDNKTADQSQVVPVNDAGVQQAVKKALPAVELQRIVEQVIDGTYRWIHGKVAQPNFAIDLTNIKTQIADNVANYLEQRLTTLPNCPAGVLPQTVDDMLQQKCRPAGLPVNAIVAQARQDALEKAVLENNQVNASTLKNSEGKPLFDAYKKVPEFYQDLVKSLVVVPVVLVLSAVGVLFASTTRRSGLRRLSIILISTGVYSTVITLLVGRGISYAASTLSHQAGAAGILQSKLVTIIQTLVADLRGWWIGFGITYLVLGIVGLIIARMAKTRSLQAAETKEKQLDHNLDIPKAETLYNPVEDPADASKSSAHQTSPSQADRKLQL